MRVLILALAAIGLLAGAGAGADEAFGPVSVPAASQAFRLGRLQLVALRDAQFVTRNDGALFKAEAGTDAVAAVLKANGLPEDRITLSVNALLVRTGRRIVLLDAGLGPKTHGVLLASLRDAGVSPESVTDVVITHSHGDHVGGLLDADGKLAFPKAVIRMAAAEWTWMQSQDNARALVQAIAAHVQTFTAGKEIAPGVTPVELGGHTPGHTGFEIVSGRQRLLDIGDIAHSSVLSLRKPEWTMGFDKDPALAKVTRRTTLARLAKDHELVFAPHFPFPGVGRIAADGDAFVWVPGTH